MLPTTYARGGRKCARGGEHYQLLYCGTRDKGTPYHQFNFMVFLTEQEEVFRADHVDHPHYGKRLVTCNHLGEIIVRDGGSRYHWS